MGRLRVNRQGHYPEGHFRDLRVAPLVAEFQARLDAIEAEITRRNANRPLPYRYLLPSMQTLGINS